MYCFTQGQVGLDSFFQLIKEIIILKKRHFVCTRVIFRKILFNDAVNNEIDWLESRISPILYILYFNNCNQNWPLTVCKCVQSNL